MEQKNNKNIIIEITILAPSGGDKAKRSPYFDSAHIIYPKSPKMDTQNQKD